MPGPGRRTIWLCTTVSTSVCGSSFVITGLRMSASRNSVCSSFARGGPRVEARYVLDLRVAFEPAGQLGPEVAADPGDEDAPAGHVSGTARNLTRAIRASASPRSARRRPSRSATTSSCCPRLLPPPLLELDFFAGSRSSIASSLRVIARSSLRSAVTSSCVAGRRSSSSPSACATRSRTSRACASRALDELVERVARPVARVLRAADRRLDGPLDRLADCVGQLFGSRPPLRHRSSQCSISWRGAWGPDPPAPGRGARADACCCPAIRIARCTWRKRCSRSR